MSMAAAATSILEHYFAGLQDALSLHRTLLFYIHSKKIRVCTVKCIILNGLIFLGSIFFFDQAVIPVIHWFGELLHTSAAYRDTQVEWIRSMIDSLVFVLYQVLWMYPIYCISFILNTIWYQEIADAAYRLHYGKSRPTAVSALIRDEVYRALLVTCFLVQIFVSFLIPIVGPIIGFISLSWLYSLYCFEYKWSLHGWELEKRINYLEMQWAYFAGFGSPFTMATFFVPNFVSKGIFALLFPVVRCLWNSLFAISSGSAASTSPVPTLSIFRISKWLTLHVLKSFGKWTGVKERRSKTKRYFNNTLIHMLKDIDEIVADLEKSPPNLFHYLWDKDAHGQSCPNVSIPHTIVFTNAKPTEWYFTSKTGNVLRKNTANMTTEAILKTMIPRTSVTKRQTRLQPDVVAILLYPGVDMANNTVIFLRHLDSTQLRHWLHNRNIPAYCILQQFVHPRSGHNAIIKSTWSSGVTSQVEEFKSVHRMTDRKIPVVERCKTHEGNLGMAVQSHVQEVSLIDDIHACNSSIASHFTLINKKKLVKTEIFYKIGCDNVLYMLYAQQVKIHLNQCVDRTVYPRFTAPTDFLRPFDLRHSVKRKCPNCVKAYLDEGSTFMVTYKRVIEAHRAPFDLLLEDNLQPDESKSKPIPDLYSEHRLRTTQVYEVARNAQNYLCQIEDRDKKNRLTLAQHEIKRKKHLTICSRSKVPPLLEKLCGRLSLERFNMLEKDPIFLYRVAEVCEVCNVNFNHLSSAVEKLEMKAKAPLKQRCKSAGSRTHLREKAEAQKTNRRPTAPTVLPTRPRSALPHSSSKAPTRPAVSITRSNQKGPRQRKADQIRQERELKQIESILYQLGLTLRREYGTLSIRTALAPWIKQVVDFELYDLKKVFRQANLVFNMCEWSLLAKRLHPERKRSISLTQVDRLIGDVFLTKDKRHQVGSVYQSDIEFREGYDSHQHSVFVKGVMRHLADDEEEPEKVVSVPTHPPNYSSMETINGDAYQLRIYANRSSKMKTTSLLVVLENESESHRRELQVHEILAYLDRCASKGVNEALKSQENLFQLIAKWVSIENNEMVLLS